MYFYYHNVFNNQEKLFFFPQMALAAISIMKNINIVSRNVRDIKKFCEKTVYFI